jgi:hypothetical protein
MHFKPVSVVILACLMLANPINAETWVDIDGGAYVVIEGDMLSVHDTSSFYYFDELFSEVRNGGALRLCLGADTGTGMATDCLGASYPQVGVNNEGKNRSLHFDIVNFPWIFDIFERSLRSGSSMKLSIDNGDLFYATTLNQEHFLNEVAVDILDLND